MCFSCLRFFKLSVPCLSSDVGDDLSIRFLAKFCPAGSSSSLFCEYSSVGRSETSELPRRPIESIDYSRLAPLGDLAMSTFDCRPDWNRLCYGLFKPSFLLEYF